MPITLGAQGAAGMLQAGAAPWSEEALKRKQEILDDWKKNGTFPYSDEHKQQEAERGGCLESGAHAQAADTMSTASTLGPDSGKHEVREEKHHRSLREKLKSMRGPTKAEAATMSREELIEANKNKVNFPIISLLG